MGMKLSPLTLMSVLSGGKLVSGVGRAAWCGEAEALLSFATGDTGLNSCQPIQQQWKGFFNFTFILKLWLL